MERTGFRATPAIRPRRFRPGSFRAQINVAERVTRPQAASLGHRAQLSGSADARRRRRPASASAQRQHPARPVQDRHHRSRHSSASAGGSVGAVDVPRRDVGVQRSGMRRGVSPTSRRNTSVPQGRRRRRPRSAPRVRSAPRAPTAPTVAVPTSSGRHGMNEPVPRPPLRVAAVEPPPQEPLPEAPLGLESPMVTDTQQAVAAQWIPAGPSDHVASPHSPTVSVEAVSNSGWENPTPRSPSPMSPCGSSTGTSADPASRTRPMTASQRRIHRMADEQRRGLRVQQQQRHQQHFVQQQQALRLMQRGLRSIGRDREQFSAAWEVADRLPGPTPATPPPQWYAGVHHAEPSPERVVRHSSAAESMPRSPTRKVVPITLPRGSAAQSPPPAHLHDDPPAGLNKEVHYEEPDPSKSETPPSPPVVKPNDIGMSPTPHSSKHTKPHTQPGAIPPRAIIGKVKTADAVQWVASSPPPIQVTEPTPGAASVDLTLIPAVFHEAVDETLFRVDMAAKQAITFVTQPEDMGDGRTASAWRRVEFPPVSWEGNAGTRASVAKIKSVVDQMLLCLQVGDDGGWCCCLSFHAMYRWLIDTTAR